MADQQMIDIETKAAFVGVDEDNDGKITHAELRACVRQLTGVKKLPDGLINSVLEEADQDKSGFINYEEFCNAIATCTLLETLINLFIKCDKNRDGNISPAEISRYVIELPEATRAKININRIVKECDVNQDGQISFEEFANHFMNDAEFGDGHLLGQ